MSEAFVPTFNRSVKVRFEDSRLTSDAGALLLREVDHRLNITADLADRLHDPRDPAKVRYRMVELLRERIYALALGYATQDDLDRLAHDPALKASVWNRPGKHVLEERLASQPTASRLIDWIAQDKHNLETLRSHLARPVQRHLRAAGAGRPVRRGTLDVDGFPVEVFGHQEGAAYNGHHRQLEYYPLVASFTAEGNYDHPRLGDGFIHACLRKGNAAGAEGALRFIRNACRAAAPLARHLDVRFDAAFTSGHLLDALTDDRIPFVGRIKKNAVLERRAAPYLKRPVGRPPKEGYAFCVELGRYQAQSWRHGMRIVLVVVDRPESNGQLKLIPDHFYLVTNRSKQAISAEDLLEHYRKRGTFEDRLGEFNQAVGTRLSLPSFTENEALLLLALLAYNLLSVLRGELEASTSSGWDAARVQKQVLKAGARVVKGARRLLFQVARPVSRLWKRVGRRLARWRITPSPASPRPRPYHPLPLHAHRMPVLRL